MSYRAQHQPSADGTPLHRADEAFPDLFDRPELYMHGSEHYPESLAAIRKARGNPEAWLIVYRAAPPEAGRINPGDWVTLSRTYAEQHAIQDDDPANDWPVYTQSVLARSVLTDGNDLNEWGWFPEPEHFCKDGSIQPGTDELCCRDFWAAAASSPEDLPCDACNAEPGEPCRPGCLGYALATGQLEEAPSNHD